MSTTAQRVTSADVAREVGVSRATVSYVLNDTPHQKIPDGTRQRVREAAARLGYSPSAAARALRSGRSDVVLFLLPDWPLGTQSGRLIEQLTIALARHGLTLLCHQQGPADESSFPAWSSVSAAAVIAYEQFNEDQAVALNAAAIPFTLSLLDGPEQGRHSLHQEAVGRIQVEHLAEQGHRRLGYALPDDPRLECFFRPRLEGVRKACADLGLDEPVPITVPFDRSAAAFAVTRWIDGDPKVTGICAYDDESALAVLAGMRSHQLHAPDDFAVVGTDDLPLAAVSDPPITTIRFDVAAIAENITRAIVAALEGKKPPRKILPTAPQLVIRDSA